ncbi:MAG TPA: hypothetical protein VFO65_08240, partial [Acidimicrobiales bacterium]|nr:hypothetical protein [Acidimicrobiales bacterium]
MPDPADHAYAHARAVLGPGAAAAEVAAEGLRRGGRSRSAVLGYTRHGALARSAEAEAPLLDAPPPADLTELAAVLAASRPAVERAVVDLATRHGLSPGGFARAVGLPAGTAAFRAAAVSSDWQRELDPVLLARLGGDACPGLAEALAAGEAGQGSTVAVAPPPPRPHPGVEPAGTGTRDAGAAGATTAVAAAPAPARSVRQLLALAPAVRRHAADCASCRDRLRAMVSVRTLLGQRPLEPAPAAIRSAGAHAGLLRFPARPQPAPPLEAEDGAGGGRPFSGGRRADLAAGLLVVVVIGVAVAAGIVSGRDDDRQARVEALTRVPPAGSALRVEPARVGEEWPAEVTLRNTSADPATWSAAGDVGWVTVEPDGGQLAAGSAARLRIDLGRAPEGDVKAVVRITGTDGSATQVRVATRVEHAPDLAVSRRGCDVVALVEDEAGVEHVALHWRGSVEGSAPLVVRRPGFVGRLPAGAAELTWWVVAVDARGNEARSGDAAVEPG